MLLRVESLRVRYRNGAIGVSDVSLDVDSGETVVLFGPNGAGKTTSVRAISGFMRSEQAKVVAGSVSLDGRSITNLEPHRTGAVGVAFVPERRKIFANMTVRENLEVVHKRPPRVRRAMIDDRIAGLFPVLAARRSQLAGQLSGGERQMLAIARSLMCEPRLLIIDEVTLGLHHSLHVPLFEAVKAIAADGAGVLVVDESAGSSVSMADRWYALADGRVSSSGSSGEPTGGGLAVGGAEA